MNKCLHGIRLNLFVPQKNKKPVKLLSLKEAHYISTKNQKRKEKLPATEGIKEKRKMNINFNAVEDEA